MAVSVKNTGVINPIEIDKNNMIITGEMRWRASKEAGLTEVPCKVLELNDKERYLRQVHENLHDISMNHWDIAEALKKSVTLIPSAADQTKVGRPAEIHRDLLSKEFGKSSGWISEHLLLLKEVGEIRAALKKEELDYTKLQEYRRFPEKHQDWAKKKLLLNKEITRDALRVVATQICRAEKAGELDVVKEIKKIDWSKHKGVYKTSGKLHEIYPPERQFIDNAQKAAKLIQTKLIELIELLEAYPLGFFGKLANISVTPFLLKGVEVIGDYLANKPVQGNFKLKGRKK